jgi:hypothetical protein
VTVIARVLLPASYCAFISDNYEKRLDKIGAMRTGVEP